MLIEQAPWLGWALLGVTVVLAVVGFIFSPWMGIAALGVDAFLVVMAMSFVIMAYGFNSVTGVNMPLHTLSLENNKIRVEFEDGKTVDIAKENARPYKIYPGGVLVPVEGQKKGWLWIPPKAFLTPEEFMVFVKEIYESHTE